jgi:hypothetical protein
MLVTFIAKEIRVLQHPSQTLTTCQRRAEAGSIAAVWFPIISSTYIALPPARSRSAKCSSSSCTAQACWDQAQVHCRLSGSRRYIKQLCTTDPPDPAALRQALQQPAHRPPRGQQEPWHKPIEVHCGDPDPFEQLLLQRSSPFRQQP